MVRIALAATFSRHRVELVPHPRIDRRTAITLTPYLGANRIARKSGPPSGVVTHRVDSQVGWPAGGQLSPNETPIDHLQVLSENRGRVSGPDSAASGSQN
jgi:hypothetical protein